MKQKKLHYKNLNKNKKINKKGMKQNNLHQKHFNKDKNKTRHSSSASRRLTASKEVIYSQTRSH